MAKYTIELPVEVEDFILADKGIQPLTYLQNELVRPIVKEYTKKVKQENDTAAQVKTDDTIKIVKKKMSVVEDEGKVSDNTDWYRGNMELSNKF